MNELELKIKTYAQAYYEGEPLIPDIEFDSLVAELKSSNPDSPLLSTPGWGYSIESSHLKKFPHTFLCGSLEKLNIPKILSGQDKWKANGKIKATSKLDGNSGVCYYENGILTRILSRGDGDYGCDITTNIKHTIPKILSRQWISAVRGEIIMPYSSFEKIGGSHPRNVATGLSQSKYAKQEDLDCLMFIPYWIKDYSEQDVYEILQNEGFPAIPSYEFDTFVDFVASLSDPDLRGKYDMNGQLPIDGIVLTDEEGNQIAVKFEDESTTTTVTDITWTMSRTGRLVPVLSVETVNLRGANISKVTANNATWIMEQGCGIGSVIDIVRANEVIPKVVNVQVKTSVDVPHNCPICNSKLEQYNRDIVCNNDDCDTKLYKMYYNIFDSVGIDGVGPAVIDSVLEHFELDSLAAIRYFIDHYDERALLDLLKPAKTELFIKCVDAIKNNPISIKQVILNANIPNVGNSCTNALYDYYKSMDELFDAEEMLPDSLFPTYLARENYETYIERVIDLIFFYGKKNITFKGNTGANMKKVNITLTGALSKPRPALVKEFNTIPGVEVNEVSIGKADYLVTDSTELTSSKAKEALKRNIPIITEQEFRDMLCQ